MCTHVLTIIWVWFPLSFWKFYTLLGMIKVGYICTYHFWWFSVLLLWDFLFHSNRYFSTCYFFETLYICTIILEVLSVYTCKCTFNFKFVNIFPESFQQCNWADVPRPSMLGWVQGTPAIFMPTHLRRGGH
jgi:hypothetical protein